MLVKLRTICDGRLLIVYRKNGKYYLRPFFREKEDEYGKKIWLGRPERFDPSRNIGGRPVSELIDEAWNWKIDERRRQAKTAAAALQEVKLFHESYMGRPVPGYALDGKGIEKLRKLIPLIEREGTRNYYRAEFRDILRPATR
jgi:hypothetical protein